MRFRQILFWVHLVAGLIAGASIGIMCFTGTMLAFEKELTAWSERDARRVEVPANTSRLSLDKMQAQVRAARPELRATSLVVHNDPGAAVAFSTGRTGGVYVNPYTGEVREPASRRVGTFMHTMVDLHRYLGFHGEESRPRGKLINGVCNIAFCVLALTGLYLWMPRTWSWRALRPVIWFRQNSSSKARDFNWHNAIGFWTAPILIILTLTAIPISFRWGGTLIQTLTGTPPPVSGTPAAASVEGPTPAVGAKPLSQEALFAAAQEAMPQWQTITHRLPSAPARGAASVLPPITLTIREAGTWPRTASTTLALDPFTGAILRRTGYAELSAAQQVRSWTRFLHTGEAVGPLGQFIAGLACLGGVFLVYTGFALSWRRFFGKRPQAPAPRSAEDAVR